MSYFDEVMLRVHEERQRIINSKIVARATIKQEGKDGVLIIVAFELSDRNSFWFTFSAKTSRSPRRTWVFKSKHILWQGKVMALEDMIKFHVGTGADSAKIVKRYPSGKRALTSKTNSVINPITAPAPMPGTLRVDRVNQKLARKMRGSVPMGWGSR